MAYLNGDELDGRHILPEATVGLLTHGSHIAPGKTPESAGQDKVYPGLGWFVVPEGDSFYIANSGGGPRFATSMRLYPERNLDPVASIDWP